MVVCPEEIADRYGYTTAAQLEGKAQGVPEWRTGVRCFVRLGQQAVTGDHIDRAPTKLHAQLDGYIPHS
jgi:hypothetical protein